MRAPYRGRGDGRGVAAPGQDIQPEELERAHNLARDLENEILKHLETRDDDTS